MPLPHKCHAIITTSWPQALPTPPRCHMTPVRYRCRVGACAQRYMIAVSVPAPLAGQGRQASRRAVPQLGGRYVRYAWGSVAQPQAAWHMLVLRRVHGIGAGRLIDDEANERAGAVHALHTVELNIRRG